MIVLLAALTVMAVLIIVVPYLVMLGFGAFGVEIEYWLSMVICGLVYLVIGKGPLE